MPEAAPAPDETHAQIPFGQFAFDVTFQASGGGDFAPFAAVMDAAVGGFSEVSGLEATMEPKVIKQGGMNYGAIQRAGPVTFATVVLKRGVITSRHLWDWWSYFAGGDGAANGGWGGGSRCDVTIGLTRDFETGTGFNIKTERKVMLGWKMINAMPIKFKSADLNARGTEIAIEEIHLVHEGLFGRNVGSPQQ